MNVKLQTACITFDGGSNFYVNFTEEGLYRQLADFCREHWSDAFPDESEDPSVSDDESFSMTDKEIVDAYFEQMGDEGESLEIGEADLLVSHKMLDWASR